MHVPASPHRIRGWLQSVLLGLGFLLAHRLGTAADPGSIHATHAPAPALGLHRQAIDALDVRIVELLNQRASHARAIGVEKRRSQLDAYAPQREQAVLQRVETLNAGPLPNRSLRAIYREIMSGSLALEQPLTIAYLGPATTFSHQAALARFGSSVDYAPSGSIPDVVAAAARGTADYAVVPFENSTEGAVTPTLDALLATDLRAIAEVRLAVVHCLATRAGSTNAIRRLHVHPQTRAQCRQWIARVLPGVEILETASNARSAERAAADASSAALCGRWTAETQHLPILAEGVQDESENTTRFLVLGRTEPSPGPHDRTTLIVGPGTTPASLQAVLAPLRAHGIPVERIHSRPDRAHPESQVFFLDCLGHQRNLGFAEALGELKKSGLPIRVLGSYPTDPVTIR